MKLDEFKGDENDDEDVSTLIPDIPEYLSTRDEKKKGQCQLYAAALLINIEDPEAARYLIQKSQTLPPQSMAYKYLTKGGVFADFLRINTNYTIAKVKRKKLLAEQYLLYLQNKELDEKWILILKDHNGSEHHAVGFDCKTQLIYDSCEKKAMKMSLENLSRCCGRNNMFHSIKLMVQLVQKPLSQKRKK